MSDTMDQYTGPHFKNIALVTIDVQRDFLDDGVCAIPGTTSILPQIATLLSAFRAARLPIVHVIRIYKADGSNVDLCRRAAIESGGAIVQPGTAGIELASALMPRGADSLDTSLLVTGALQQLGEQEWVMYKSRWGAFYRTHLEDQLRTLGITTIAFTGCNFPNCPRASIYEASERDFRVVLVEDAVSGVYDRGKDELKNIGVSIISTKELTEALSARSSAGCA